MWTLTKRSWIHLTLYHTVKLFWRLWWSTEEDSRQSRCNKEVNDNVFCCCVSVLGLFCDALIVVFQSFVSFILTCIFGLSSFFFCETKHMVMLALRKEKSREWKDKKDRLTLFCCCWKSLFYISWLLKIFMVNGSPLNLFKIHCAWNLYFSFKLLGKSKVLGCRISPPHSVSSSCAVSHLLVSLFWLIPESLLCQCYNVTLCPSWCSSPVFQYSKFLDGYISVHPSIHSSITL